MTGVQTCALPIYDIDIAMPRCDYEHFLHIVQTEKEIAPSIFLQNMYTDNDIFFGGYSKIRYSESTGILKRDYKHRCNHGVWIDIFPLDNRIADSRKWSRQYRRIRYIQKLMYYKVYKKDRHHPDTAYNYIRRTYRDIPYTTPEFVSRHSRTFSARSPQSNGRSY